MTKITKLGLYVWIEKVHNSIGSGAFLFRDLPSELKSSSDIRCAIDNGFVECVGMRYIGPTSHRKVYMLTEKTHKRFV